MKTGIFLTVLGLLMLCFHTESSTFHNRLYQEILTTKANENIIYSPFSVKLCLALAHKGSLGNTASEIGNVIGYSSDADQAKVLKVLNSLHEKDVLQVANKIYVRTGETLNPQYETSIQRDLKSGIESIDFSHNVAAAKTISDWVAQQTNQKIKDLVTPNDIDPTTALLLVNAVYFKGYWVTEFNDAVPDKFTNYDNSIAMVSMMSKTSTWKEMTYLDSISSHVVKFDYRDTNIGMYLVVPDAKDGILKIEQNLDKLNFHDIKSQMHSTFMNIYMPKFEFETGHQLANALKKMGITTAFGGDADFTNILSSKQRFSIADVIHKAFIKVDEKGTEAGAATFIPLLGSAFATPNVTIKADRPFMFAIVSDDYDVPLFMGTVKKLK